MPALLLKKAPRLTALELADPRVPLWDKVDVAIARASGGCYAHAEYRADDGRCFSIRQGNGEGACWLPFIDTWIAVPQGGLLLSPWDVIELPWAETSQAMSFAESRIGYQYDYFAAVSSARGFEVVSRQGRCFCSELVAELTMRCDGAPQFPAGPNPCKLAALVRGAMGLVAAGQGVCDTALLDSLMPELRAKCEGIVGSCVGGVRGSEP